MMVGDNKLCKCGHKAHLHKWDYAETVALEGCKHCACQSFLLVENHEQEKEQ